jgi:hypothetical protein
MAQGLATMYKVPSVPQTEEQVIAHFKANYTVGTATELITMFQDQLDKGKAVNIAYASTLVKYIVINDAKYAVSHEKAT